MSLSNCRVVLVRPQVAGNLGATARVMRNMGLSDLVLVAPVADPADPRARQLSTHGEPILDRARIVGELGEAVADCILVAGTSARTGGPFRRQSVGPPDEIMPHVVEALARGPVALVFGPDPSGLTNDEVTPLPFSRPHPGGSELPGVEPGPGRRHLPVRVAPHLAEA